MDIENVIELLGAKKSQDSSPKKGIMRLLAVIGVLAILFTVAFAVYRQFSKRDYIEDFDDDFEDELDDDFDDDFFNSCTSNPIEDEDDSNK